MYSFALLSFMHAMISRFEVVVARGHLFEDDKSCEVCSAKDPIFVTLAHILCLAHLIPGPSSAVFRKHVFFIPRQEGNETEKRMRMKKFSRLLLFSPSSKRSQTPCSAQQWKQDPMWTKKNKFRRRLSLGFRKSFPSIFRSLSQLFFSFTLRKALKMTTYP